MKQNLPLPAIIGIIAGAVLIVVAIGLFALRDKPTAAVASPAGKTAPPPPMDQPMPDWAREKLKSSQSASAGSN